jgi:hypothetical protein
MSGSAIAPELCFPHFADDRPSAVELFVEVERVLELHLSAAVDLDEETDHLDAVIAFEIALIGE